MRIPTVLAAALVAGSLIGGTPAHATEAVTGTGLIANLSGTNELPPGSGDPDGTGVFLATIKPGSGRICYVIHVRDFHGKVTGAHVHVGAVGTEGDAVATLEPPTVIGSVAACTWVGRKLATAIRKGPQKYYVNVHSDAFPDGAMRGQLRKA